MIKGFLDVKIIPKTIYQRGFLMLLTIFPENDKIENFMQILKM
jgi:hypothetical protein